MGPKQLTRTLIGFHSCYLCLFNQQQEFAAFFKKATVNDERSELSKTRDKSTELFAIAHRYFKEIRCTDWHKQLHRWA